MGGQRSPLCRQGAVVCGAMLALGVGPGRWGQGGSVPPPRGVLPGRGRGALWVIPPPPSSRVGPCAPSGLLLNSSGSCSINCAQGSAVNSPPPSLGPPRACCQPQGPPHSAAPPQCNPISPWGWAPLCPSGGGCSPRQSGWVLGGTLGPAPLMSCSRGWRRWAGRSPWLPPMAALCNATDVGGSARPGVVPGPRKQST
ncbi:unnamed protein product [Natator depressus]